MHEYQKRILRAQDFLQRFPGVSDVDCRHDEWCGVYLEEECNCDPYIVVRTPNGQLFKLLADGVIEQIIIV